MTNFDKFDKRTCQILLTTFIRILPKEMVYFDLSFIVRINNINLTDILEKTILNFSRRTGFYILDGFEPHVHFCSN